MLVVDNDPGFRRYLAAIEHYPRLDRRTELRLARAFRRHGDQAAADSLIHAHLRTVVAIASRFCGYGIRVADLVEEGNLGLLEGLRRFDPGRNIRFMTYVSYWVRAYILAHILKHWSIVGVGSGPMQSRMFFRLHGERSRLANLLGERADGIESTLAARFGTTEEQIRAMTGRLGNRDTSLDTRAYADGDATLLDLIVDRAADQETSTAEAERDRRVRDLLAGAVAALDAREQLILHERLMAGDDSVTLADLGRRLGVSRERVRQLEERVKHKLRRVLGPVVRAAA